VKVHWLRYDPSQESITCEQVVKDLKRVKEKVVDWVGKRHRERDG
jgi:hypothetical protein